jgi:hypothetical protein
MGTLPNTESEITMGKTRNAYGLSGQITLSAGLGGAANIHLSGSGPVTLQPFPFSSRLGGRQTPFNY